VVFVGAIPAIPGHRRMQPGTGGERPPPAVDMTPSDQSITQCDEWQKIATPPGRGNMLPLVTA